jgi:hypothetical protein
MLWEDLIEDGKQPANIGSSKTVLETELASRPFNLKVLSMAGKFLYQSACLNAMLIWMPESNA